MANKHVELKNDTRILLNKTKSIILAKNPKLLKLTDDKAIAIALLEFTLEGKK